MIVLTVDQQASRRTGDRVEALLTHLAAAPYPTERPFERTAGDEVQGVLADPSAVVALVADLARSGGWSIGVGIGAVTDPLPASTRAGAGPAFSNARTAVERAKSRPHALAVEASDAVAGRRAQTALELLLAVLQRRSRRGWEAADHAAAGRTQTEIAEVLGVTKQAVSQRLLTAGWHLEAPTRELAAHLVSEADGTLPS